MPYLVARRPEIQAGHIQITDLFPNQSLANPTIDPKPQGPFYVRPADFGTAFGSTPVLISSGNEVIVEQDSKGLTAYLLRHVENGLGEALTAQEAVLVANEVKAFVEAGLQISNADLNTAVANAGLASDFDGNATTSNGVVEDVIRILSGETYILPAGTKIQDGNGAFIPVIGDAGLQSDVRRLVDRDASWKVSLSSGSLRGLVSTLPEGNDFAGAESRDPLITVYNSDGTLYPV